MSGGSFNYLCAATLRGDLGSSTGSIAEMRDAFAEVGYAEDAAAATQHVLDLIDAANKAADALNAIWQAMEWWHSSDWGEDDVKEALEQWRVERPTQPIPTPTGG